jgi:hypothetical protein
MPRTARHQVTVLLDEADGERFAAYCSQRGFKKSTLIVRLIREHLERESFALQPNLFEQGKGRGEVPSQPGGTPRLSTTQTVKRGHG